MKLSDFDFTYPPELVARYPLEDRASSRMMVLDRAAGKWSHRAFRDFPGFFEPGQVLVLNDSKVFPCRLLAHKPSGAAIEFLLLREAGNSVWECLISRSKKIALGERFEFSPELSGEVLDAHEDADSPKPRKIRLTHAEPLHALLERHGHVPLPPYLKREDEPDFDKARYQTVYARQVGSVAAPTAGFHFTEEILNALKVKGVTIATVTLHVGIGTFLPIRAEEVERHLMHGEFYEIPAETRDAVMRAKREGKPVSVVGTTAVRALESAWDEQAGLKAGGGYTEKFIYPPYAFKAVDRLLTNFHQPKSTLLLLVSAFAGADLIRRAYEEAIRERYRLFSYGDCMWMI